MAKQAGDIFIKGTIDDLCFYKMDGKYYVRMKSSLSGKRFWKDKAFEGSRKSCSRFGEGNQLASIVFQFVNKERRANRLFPFLRTKAIGLLKEERGAEEVISVLLEYLVDFGFIKSENFKDADTRGDLMRKSCAQESNKMNFVVEIDNKGLQFFDPSAFSLQAFNSS